MKKSPSTSQGLWVVNAVSESTDHYGPFVFDHKPSDKEIIALFRKEAPGEWPEDGPGDYGSWLFISNVRAKVR